MGAKLCMICGALFHDSLEKCKFCDSDNVILFNDSEMKIIDAEIITAVTHNANVMLAMNELHQKDIIEYELKMSQFRAQIEQQKRIVQQQNNQPHCPYCNSINIKKITATQKVGKAALFGLFAVGDMSKTWKCNNCGSKW